MKGDIRAKYIYGLSATPNRSDCLDDIIYMLLGPVRHKYTAKEEEWYLRPADRGRKRALRRY